MKTRHTSGEKSFDKQTLLLLLIVSVSGLQTRLYRFDANFRLERKFLRLTFANALTYQQ